MTHDFVHQPDHLQDYRLYDFDHHLKNTIHVPMIVILIILITQQSP